MSCTPWGLWDKLSWSLGEYSRRCREKEERCNLPWTLGADLRRYVSLTPVDAAWILVATLAVTAVRAWLRRQVLANLQGSQSRLEAAAESTFKLAFYASSSVYMWSLVLFGPWTWVWTKPERIMDSWSLDVSVPLDLYVLLVVEAGYYFHSIYGLFALEARRKDTFVMLTHHIVALILILLSTGTKLHLFGLLILLFHDICDVFLESGKLNKILAVTRPSAATLHENAGLASFILFASTWVALRTIIFPCKAIPAIFYAPVKADIVPRYPFYPVFTSLVSAIYAMDCFWCCFILRTLYVAIRSGGKEVEDFREKED